MIYSSSPPNSASNEGVLSPRQECESNDTPYSTLMHQSVKDLCKKARILLKFALTYNGIDMHFITMFLPKEHQIDGLVGIA